MVQSGAVAFGPWVSEPDSLRSAVQAGSMNRVSTKSRQGHSIRIVGPSHCITGSIRIDYQCVARMVWEDKICLKQDVTTPGKPDPSPLHPHRHPHASYSTSHWC